MASLTDTDESMHHPGGATSPTDCPPVPQHCSNTTLELDFPWLAPSSSDLPDGASSPPVGAEATTARFYHGGYSPYGTTPWYQEMTRDDLIPATGPIMDLLQGRGEDLMGRTGESGGSREDLGDFFDWSFSGVQSLPEAMSPTPGQVAGAGYSAGQSGGDLLEVESPPLIADSPSPSATIGCTSTSPESSRLSIASSGYYSSLSPLEIDSADSPPPLVAATDPDSGFGYLDITSAPLDAHHSHKDRGELADVIPTSYHQPTSPETETQSSPPEKKEVLAPIKMTDPSAKPGVTYIELIARALLTVKEHKMILIDIYADIIQRYPYYETAPSTWRNAVRHNLCVNDCFIKAERSNSGRGFFWAIHPACVKMFKQGDFRRAQARRLAQQMDITKMASSSSSTISRSTLGTTATPSYAHFAQGPSHYQQQHQVGMTRLTPIAPANQVVRLTSGSSSHAHFSITNQQRALHHMTYQVTPHSRYSPAPCNRSHGQLVKGGTYQYYQPYSGPASTSTPNCQSYYTTPMYR